MPLTNDLENISRRLVNLEQNQTKVRIGRFSSFVEGTTDESFDLIFSNRGGNIRLGNQNIIRPPIGNFIKGKVAWLEGENVSKDGEAFM